MSTNGSTLPKKNNTSFEKNPFYVRIERAPYELARLLQALPARSSEVDRSDKRQMQQLDAARQHAANSTETLLGGLEAIGSFMFVAGTNKGFTVNDNAAAHLGDLIQHIAVELQFLVELQGEFAEVLGEGV